MSSYLYKNTIYHTGPLTLAEFRVDFLGGMSHMAQGEGDRVLTLRLWENRITLSPSWSTRKTWQTVSVPYSALIDITVGPDTDIQLIYCLYNGSSRTVRLRMRSGLTDAARARKAHKILGVIDMYDLRPKFGGKSVAEQFAALDVLLRSDVINGGEWRRYQRRVADRMRQASRDTAGS